AAQQLVVRLELVLDSRRVRDPLGPEHLLHLVPDGPVILEQQRDVGAHVDAPGCLRRDDLAPDIVAHPLVGREVEDLAALDGLHVGASSALDGPAAAGTTRVGKPSSRYARARIDIGWRAGWPACWRNWSAASGHSVAHTEASTSLRPSKALWPIRCDGSNPSTVMA